MFRWSLSAMSTAYSSGEGPVGSDAGAGELAAAGELAPALLAGCEAASVMYTFAGLDVPSITMVELHLRQRIFARRAWIFSSATEYLAAHEGQEIFTVGLFRWTLERAG
jgi:hypothetical protein